MKRIATKEKVICLFSVLLECGDVELSCGSLFLFKFDPVITFSQNGVITFSQDGIE